jgi:hypothetical protein
LELPQPAASAKSNTIQKEAKGFLRELL